MSPRIEALVDRGTRNLRAARILFDQELFDVAVSRAYYAMFYLAEAALVSRDLAFSRHSTVIAQFHQEFVRSGLLPQRCHDALQRVFDDRNTADYAEDVVVPAERACVDLEAAEAFVSQVETWLRKEAG